MKKLFTFIACALFAISASAYEQISTSFGSWGAGCTVEGNTLTFTEAWKGAGVGFVTGDGETKPKKCTDMSDYDYLWLTFSETTCDFQLTTQYTLGYNQDVTVGCVAGSLVAGVKLNENYSDQFAQYYIQSKSVGKVAVTGAYVGTEKEYKEFLDKNKVQKSPVDLTGWGKWDPAIDIVENADGTMSITYPDAWKGANKWFGAKDCSAFDYAVLEIAEPVEFQTQLWLQYNESKDENNSAEAFIEPGETSVKLALDERKNKVDQIAVQTSTTGTVTIKAIYFCTKDYNPSTGISNAVAAPTAKVSKIFNLAGRQVDASYKGVVIKGGKKYVQK